jgi:omega-amidase
VTRSRNILKNSPFNLLAEQPCELKQIIKPISGIYPMIQKMDENITITLVQPDIVWESIGSNLEYYSSLFRQNSEKTDLIVLPEMFTTGFSMNTQYLAEKEGELTMKWMEKWSRKMDCVITGSIIATERGRFFNRLVWMRPDGSCSFYDKRHLFRMGKEELYYTRGTRKLITEVRGWKICPLICYDLRFPVWSKNRYSNNQWDYDILIYIANWPASRDNIWTTLLTARAIENQAFVAGVNRVGTDGNELSYTGNSMIINLEGNVEGVCDKEYPDYKTFRISSEKLAATRDKLGAGKDWDLFDLRL